MLALGALDALLPGHIKYLLSVVHCSLHRGMCEYVYFSPVLFRELQASCVWCCWCVAGEEWCARGGGVSPRGAGGARRRRDRGAARRACRFRATAPRETLKFEKTLGTQVCCAVAGGLALGRSYRSPPPLVLARNPAGRHSGEIRYRPGRVPGSTWGVSSSPVHRTFVSGCEGPSIAVLRSVLVV